MSDRLEHPFRSLTATKELSAADLGEMERNVQDYRRWIDCHVAPGDTMTPTGLPCGPCGLCAIPDFHNGSVHSVKVIGREAPAYKKLRSVQQVRLVLDRVAADLSAEECRTAAQTIRGTPELCRSGYTCYYPEVIRGSQSEAQRSSIE